MADYSNTIRTRPVARQKYIPIEQRLTPTQAAARLNVARPTIYRWVWAGILPAYRLGSRKLYLDLHEVDRAFLAVNL